MNSITKVMKLNLISVGGLVLLFGGLVFVAMGVLLNGKATAGLASLDAVYAVQGRYMTYDDDGNFTDRGTKTGGDAILTLIEEDWQFELNRANLDPNDTLVNTPDELMVQYGTISYHTLHGTQTVVLDEAVEYDGVMYEAGSYDVDVDGRYFSDLDRKHPLESPVRTQAWSPLAFGLLSSLIGGMNSDYQAGMAHFMSWSIFMGLGVMFAVAGVFVTLGGVQVTRGAEATAAVKAKDEREAAIPIGGLAPVGSSYRALSAPPPHSGRRGLLFVNANSIRIWFLGRYGAVARWIQVQTLGTMRTDHFRNPD
jgi:hypothetical protein